MSSETPVHNPLIQRTRRIIYVALGSIFVGLGVLGAFLPVMPTTPFLLVASFFFARSSPRLNRWLVRSPLFGPFLRDWQQHRGVRPHVKVLAITVMVTAVTASIVWGNLAWPFVVLVLLLAGVGLWVVLRLPVIRETPPATVEVQTTNKHRYRTASKMMGRDVNSGR